MARASRDRQLRKLSQTSKKEQTDKGERLASTLIAQESYYLVGKQSRNKKSTGKLPGTVAFKGLEMLANSKSGKMRRIPN